MPEPDGINATELIRTRMSRGSDRCDVGSLPDDTHPARARVVIREGFQRMSPDLYERSRYEYELVDRARDFRRAFHLHFPEWFGRRFLVVVHEHCERPIGLVGCEHYAGRPIKDAYEGVATIMDVWTAEPPHCEALKCLDQVNSPGVLRNPGA
jgi:hypothetical protein